MSEKQAGKLNIAMIVVVAVSAVVGSFVAGAVVKLLSGSNVSVDEVLVKTADELNRKLPMMVDQVTRLDSTAALPGKKLLYKYTIVGANPMPTQETIINAMRPLTINNFKTSQEMATLRKMRVTLVYSYRDEKGNEVAQFEIGPKDIGVEE